MYLLVGYVFFFMQQTAYYLRISDWSSDVCSSDLMVYASSSSVYGANKHMPFCVDDRVDPPIAIYAATKKDDELMSDTHSRLYRMPLTGLSFLIVYSTWGRRDMSMWFFADGRLTGQASKSFTDVGLRRGCSST